MDKALRILLIVIECKTHAGGGGNPEKLVQRLCAVMPGADRHAVRIKDCRNVMRVYAVHGECDDSVMLLGALAPDNVNMRNFMQKASMKLIKIFCTSCSLSF